MLENSIMSMIMAKRAKRNGFFEGIKAGLEEAFAWADGKAMPVTIREVELPDSPKPRGYCDRTETLAGRYVGEAQKLAPSAVRAMLVHKKKQRGY